MSKFRNTNNVLFLRELFEETALNKENILYTLKDQDTEYPSLHRLYMESNDPTEYSFAVAHLEGWEHWKALSESQFFKNYIARWREELEVKLRSETLARILETSRNGGKDAFQANKYITDRGYDKPRTTKGRPTKVQIQNAANDIALSARRESEDLERMLN